MYSYNASIQYKLHLSDVFGCVWIRENTLHCTSCNRYFEMASSERNVSVSEHVGQIGGGSSELCCLKHRLST